MVTVLESDINPYPNDPPRNVIILAKSEIGEISLEEDQMRSRNGTGYQEY